MSYNYNMNKFIPYIPPIILIFTIVLAYYETLSSPNENKKTKLLETLQSNIMRYLIPCLLIIKIYNKQKICVSTVTIIILSIISSFNKFSKGFRLASIMIYTGYSYNCLFCPISSHQTYWFDVLLPILIILITLMKNDRGEKII